MLMQPFAVGVRRIPCAKDAERNFGRREVRLDLFDNASQRFESFPMPVHNRSYAWIERHSAEILKPCDAHTFEIPIERPCEPFSGFIDRQWRPRIRPRDGAERRP